MNMTGRNMAGRKVPSFSRGQGRSDCGGRKGSEVLHEGSLKPEKNIEKSTFEEGIRK